jgi:hypothetical protein
MTNHATSNCFWEGHPLHNNTHKTWYNSEKGLAFRYAGQSYLRLGVKIPGYCAATQEDLNSAKEAKRSNRPYVHVHDNSLRPGKTQRTGYLGKNSRPYNYNNTTNNNNNSSYTPKDTDNKRESPLTTMCAPITLLPLPEYLPIYLSLLDTATEETTFRTGQGMVTTPTEARAHVRDKAAHPTTNKEIKAHSLLDSGSLAGDFISQNTLTLLGGIGREYNSPEPLRVCSGLDNACYDSTHVVDVLVSLSFIECNIEHTFILTCRISLKGQVNLIIGRDSIKQSGLAKILPRFFFNPETDTSHIHNCLSCTPTHGDKRNRQTHLATIPCACAI